MAAERARLKLFSRPAASFNGAATGWPRNALGSCAMRGVVPSFNGAATGWPRNALTNWLSSLVRNGFNGAATGWPRNVVSRSLPFANCHKLQWGRDRMAAERAPDPPPHQQVQPASMGPRPDGRGTRRPARPERTAPMLQWGRDRMAAERGEPIPDRTERQPSMGPRPDGRGTVYDPTNQVPAPYLQWGRDRMAAERNGAIVGYRQMLLPSMGPRPDGRGTCSATMRPRSRSAPFNGAATGWPRNVAGRRHFPSSQPPSMGPRPDGRGTRN